MKKIFVFTLVTALALCAAEVYPAEPNKKAQEANRLAREGADAAKSQDWDKAVELLRKATNLEHKYADQLAAVYQGRGYAAAKNHQFQEAVQDFAEAPKIQSNDQRIHGQRAAAEMKVDGYDKALPGNSEA